MGLNADTLQVAGLAVWLAGALYFILRLRVFAPQPLKQAPLRPSELSLPIVGAVIVLYILTQYACVAGALALGVPREVFAPETAPAATSAPAMSAPGATGPMTAVSSSAPAAQAATPPSATTPVYSDVDREVVFNWIGIGSAVLTLVPVLIIVPRLCKGGFAGWGLNLKRLPRGVGLGLGGFAIDYPILLAFGEALVWVYLRGFNHEMSEHPTFQTLDQHVSVGRQVLLCFAAVIVAPISEEIFFRGIVQTTLVQRGWGFLVPQFLRSVAPSEDYRPSAWHRWGAILLTSALFGSVHQWDQAPIIFVLAVGLGYLYERTGNLWACIVMHMTFNGMQIGAYLASGGHS